MIRALGPQQVGEREITIEVAHVNRPDRGQLVHDHVRVRPAHRLGDLIGIKRISHHRRRAQLSNQTLVGLLTGHPHDLMAGGHKPWHKLPANRSRRPSHGKLLIINSFIKNHPYPLYDKTAAPAVTPPTPPRERRLRRRSNPAPVSPPQPEAKPGLDTVSDRSEGVWPFLRSAPLPVLGRCRATHIGRRPSFVEASRPSARLSTFLTVVRSTRR